MNSKSLLLLISFSVMGNFIEARPSGTTGSCHQTVISLNTVDIEKFRENLKVDLQYLNCTNSSIVNITIADLEKPKNGSFTTQSDVFCDSLQHIKSWKSLNLSSFDYLLKTVFQNKTLCLLVCSMDLNESLWPYCEFIKNITAGGITESLESPPRGENTALNQPPTNNTKGTKKSSTTPAPDQTRNSDVSTSTDLTREKSGASGKMVDKLTNNSTETSHRVTMANPKEISADAGKPIDPDFIETVRNNLKVDLQNLNRTKPGIMNISIADLEQPKNGSFTTPPDVFCHSVQNIKSWESFNLTSFDDLHKNIFKNESLCLRVCSLPSNESIIWPYCELIKNITIITVTNVTTPSELPVFMNPSDESHTFNYLVVISILCIICYFGIYNKKKILALLIEGRNRKDRRRHASAGYRKLNTNLEEVMPFTSAPASDSMIY